MNYKLRLLTLIFTASFLSSCLGFEEKIFMRKDGSGTFTYTLDITEALKKTMQFANAFKNALTDSADAKPKLSKEEEYQKEIDKGFGEFKEKFLFNREEIDKNNAIKNFQQFTDTAKGAFKFGCRFDFTNVDALNKTLKSLFIPQQKDKSEKRDGMPAAIYKFEKGVLSRELKKDDVKSFIGNYDVDDKMTKSLLEGMYFRIVMETDGEIVSANSAGAKVKSENNRVEFDYDIFEKGKEIVKTNMRCEAKLK